MEFAVGQRGVETLEALVRQDSASDERSPTTPSSDGQRRLAVWIADWLRQRGVAAEIDGQGNVVGRVAGRGRGAGAAPIALMAHLDTARGTVAPPALRRVAQWDGQAIAFPARPALQVDVANYPSLQEFVGQTVVHGDGVAPFGLDDKLGLAEILTLVEWLACEPLSDAPPLVVVARPDEEIGRMEAVGEVAQTLALHGVRWGWTVDGIAPWEINVENFHGAVARVWLTDRSATSPPVRQAGRLWLGGVNTHGATAKAEGHRPATRLAVAILAGLRALGSGLSGPAACVPVGYGTDVERDCDGWLDLAWADDAAVDVPARIQAVAAEVVRPHVSRGASWRWEPLTGPVSAADVGPLSAALALVEAILASTEVLPVAAEDSEGRQGYSQPYRLVADGAAWRLDVRLRDFDRDALRRRGDSVRRLAPAGSRVEVVEQYGNMGDVLCREPALVELPSLAAARLGLPARVQPIRGGTGVDPFLAAGVWIGNLGSGYFAPESEKELTSVEMIASHVAWLRELVAVAAEGVAVPA